MELKQSNMVADCSLGYGFKLENINIYYWSLFHGSKEVQFIQSCLASLTKVYPSASKVHKSLRFSEIIKGRSTSGIFILTYLWLLN